MFESRRIKKKVPTHVEEGAGMFQHQLAGVRFVLAVVHIDVELISLKEKRRITYETDVHQVFQRSN